MSKNSRKNQLLWKMAIMMREVMAYHSWFHFCMMRVARFIKRLSVRIDYVVTSPFLEAQGAHEKKCKKSRLPQWVKDEMSELVDIEPDLGLTEDGRERVFDLYVIPARAEPGKVYAVAWKKVAGQRFTHVLIAPWLVQGGADLGVLYHLEQLAVLPGAHVLLITTENVKSPWIGRVDSNIRTLDLGAIGADLDFDDMVVVLVRLFLQLQPGVIHIINSRAAWEVVARHGLAVRQFSRIYVSLYCDDYNPGGGAIDYARIYLRRCIGHIDKVISDNSVMPLRWQRNFGVSKEKFAVVYFPTKFPEVPVFSPQPGTKRVLWAGRFSAQKNPALLAQIAKCTPDIQYDVYGTDSSCGIRFPKNVVIKGFFDGFESLPHAYYGCYLNTSLWDGLPNVLLEATAFGLPIVSTDVGGIPDFLNKENAFLIEDVNDIDTICEQVNLAISDHALAQQRWRNAYEILRSRHTFESMRIALSEVDGYFTCAG